MHLNLAFFFTGVCRWTRTKIRVLSTIIFMEGLRDFTPGANLSWWIWLVTTQCFIFLRFGRMEKNGSWWVWRLYFLHSNAFILLKVPPPHERSLFTMGSRFWCSPVWVRVTSPPIYLHDYLEHIFKIWHGFSTNVKKLFFCVRNFCRPPNLGGSDFRS